MLALVKQDTRLVAVLSNDGHEIQRNVCASTDAAIAAAIHMLCRRGDDLKARDVGDVPPDVAIGRAAMALR
jgi:hypothetical protein